MPSYTIDRFITDGPVHDVLRLADGTVLSDQTFNIGPVSRLEIAKTWTRTPDFWLLKKQRKLRELPMNDFSYYKRRTSFPNGSVDLKVFVADDLLYETETADGFYGSYIDSPVPYAGSPGGPLLPYIDQNALTEKAKRQVLLAIKDQKVNLMQALGERRQTARLLSDTVTRLATMVSFLKRGNLRGAARVFGVTADARRVRKYKKAWSENPTASFGQGVLELQYGWRPFFQDIYGSAELIAQKIVKESRGKATSKATERRREVVVIPGGGGHADMYYDTLRKMTVKYVIYYSTLSEDQHTLAQVGITNPALVAWELTPWSFVFDWLVPIGNYISSFDAVEGLRFEKGCATTFEYISHFGKGVSGYAPKPGGRNHFSFTGSAQSEVINLSRVHLGAFPLPEFPSLKHPFSNKRAPDQVISGGMEHAINGLALLRTSLGLENRARSRGF